MSQAFGVVGNIEDTKQGLEKFCVYNRVGKCVVWNKKNRRAKSCRSTNRPVPSKWYNLHSLSIWESFAFDAMMK